MIRYKNATVSAEWFEHSSFPSYKKYLPLPNQLHFWLALLGFLLTCHAYKTKFTAGGKKLGPIYSFYF